MKYSWFPSVISLQKYFFGQNSTKQVYNYSRVEARLLQLFGRSPLTFNAIEPKTNFFWDSGFSSSIRSKVTSKTRLLVQKMGKFNDLYLMKVKNVNISKSAPGIFLHSFAMDYTWAGPLETVIKVAVLLV